MYSGVKKTYIELLGSYMDANYLRRTPLAEINPSDKSKFLPRNQIYLGVDVIDFINNLPIFYRDENMIKDFFNNCVMFLCTGCNEIKSRFDFENNLLQQLSILQPAKAMHYNARLTMPSLLPLMKLLPRIVTPDQYQSIDDEWRRLSSHELPTEQFVISDNDDIFWSKMFKYNGEDEYKNLSKFVLDVLCLPHSNADCERIFSKVNLIKTKTRNKLVTCSINGLLLSSQRVGADCTKYEPTSEELSKMTSSILYHRSNQPKENKMEESGPEDLDLENIIMPNL